MSMIETYYYDERLRKIIVQFAAVFAGMQVQIGSSETEGPRLIQVPIKNASVDRVVGAIKGENTQNKPLRLPIMAFSLNNLVLAPELFKGIGQTRRNTYVPVGGVVPDDVRVVEQRQPVPYKAEFTLSMFASNQDQHYQLMEQILMMFNPDIQLQTSDDVFDHTRMTQLELTSISFDENVPQGVDRRTIVSTLIFTTTVYMSVPSKVHQRFVEEIFLRVGAVSNTTDLNDSYEVISDLDSQGIEYDHVFTMEDKKY